MRTDREEDGGCKARARVRSRLVVDAHSREYVRRSRGSTVSDRRARILAIRTAFSHPSRRAEGERLHLSLISSYQARNLALYYLRRTHGSARAKWRVETRVIVGEYPKRNRSHTCALSKARLVALREGERKREGKREKLLARNERNARRTLRFRGAEIAKSECQRVTGILLETGEEAAFGCDEPSFKLLIRSTRIVAPIPSEYVSLLAAGVRRNFVPV